jgi:hypothetical protein
VAFTYGASTTEAEKLAAEVTESGGKAVRFTPTAAIPSRSLSRSTRPSSSWADWTSWSTTRASPIWVTSSR